MKIISTILDRLCLAIFDRGQRAMCERDRPAQEAERARSLDMFEPFLAVWPFDALDLVEPAQRVFCRLAEDERASAIRAAPGYLASCRNARVKRMSAANWLRCKGWEARDQRITDARTTAITSV